MRSTFRKPAPFAVNVGIVRAMVGVILLWLLSIAVLGVIQSVMRPHAIETLANNITLVVFPCLFDAAALVLTISFFQRRAAQRLTRSDRGDYRFGILVLAIFSFYGHQFSYAIPAFGFACWLLVHVRTHVPSARPGARGGPS